jgi:hypothetical protein
VFVVVVFVVAVVAVVFVAVDAFVGTFRVIVYKDSEYLESY